jgi:hypothetical protein
MGKVRLITTKDDLRLSQIRNIKMVPQLEEGSE